MRRPLWGIPLVAHLLVLVLVPLFVSLGQWQWRKGEHKAAAQALRDRRGADPAVEMPSAPLEIDGDTARQLRFRPVLLRGRYLPERQFLLDNRVHRERAGFHVITPFQLGAGKTVVLINRGWVPAAARHDALPAIATPPGELTLQGIATLPPSRFFRLAAIGNTPDWQSTALPVWQGLDLKAFASQSGLPTQPLIVQLAPAAPGGFVREWPRPDDRIGRHYSYALQWFGFAVATVGIWLYFALRRPRP